MPISWARNSILTFCKKRWLRNKNAFPINLKSKMSPDPPNPLFWIGVINVQNKRANRNKIPTNQEPSKGCFNAILQKGTSLRSSRKFSWVIWYFYFEWGTSHSSSIRIIVEIGQKNYVTRWFRGSLNGVYNQFPSFAANVDAMP